MSLPRTAIGHSRLVLLLVTLAAVRLGAQPARVDYDEAIARAPNDPRGYYARGVARDNVDDYLGALADLNQAIQLNPAYAEAYYSRGLVKLELADNAGAIADFTALLRVDPKHVDGYISRGLARDALKDSAGAREDFDRALALDPRAARAYLNRGIAWARQDERKKALADYDQAIALDRNYFHAYYNRGVTRTETGDFLGAMGDFNRAITLRPNSYMGYYGRAELYTAKKEYERALVDYSQALKSSPNNGKILNARGLSRMENGDLDGARKDFEHAVAVGWENAVTNLGVVESRWSRPGQADARFEQALKINPNNVDALFNRARSRSDRGDRAGALADIERVLQLSPRDANAMHARGYIKSLGGDDRGAIADYTQALRWDPRYQLSYTERGLAELRLREYDQAISDFSRVLEMNLVQTVALDGRARAYAAQGQWARAAQDYRRIMEREAMSQDVRERLGDALVMQGDDEGAKKGLLIPAFAGPRRHEVALKQLHLKLTREHDVGGLARELDALLKADPNDLLALEYRGLSRWESYDLRGAGDDFTLLVKAEPARAQHWYRRGLVLEGRGEFAAALADYQRARAVQGAEPKQTLAEALQVDADGNQSARQWTHLLPAALIQPEESRRLTLHTALLLVRLQRLTLPAALSRVSAAWPAGSTKAIAQMLLGETSGEAFLASIPPDDLRAQSDAHYYLGLRALLASDRGAAMVHFTQASSARVALSPEGNLAEAELRRLKQPQP